MEVEASQGGAGGGQEGAGIGEMNQISQNVNGRKLDGAKS